MFFCVLHHFGCLKKSQYSKKHFAIDEAEMPKVMIIAGHTIN